MLSIFSGISTKECTFPSFLVNDVTDSTDYWSTHHRLNHDGLRGIITQSEERFYSTGWNHTGELQFNTSCFQTYKFKETDDKEYLIVHTDFIYLDSG